MKLAQVIFVSLLSSASTLALCAGAVTVAAPRLLPDLLSGLQADVMVENPKFQINASSATPMAIDITEPIEARLQTILDLAVPVDEIVPLQLAAPLAVEIEVDAKVPLQTVIEYDDVVPLNTEISTKILGIPVQLPVKSDVPIKLTVPVNQTIAVKFKAPVKVTLSETIQIPVKFDFDTQIPVDQLVKIPVTKPLKASLQTADGPMTVELDDTNLQLKLNRVGGEQ